MNKVASLSNFLENSYYIPNPPRICGGFLFYYYTKKDVILLVDVELKPYVRLVMQRFSCNEKVAEAIIQSSKENGELEGIKNMCTVAPTERSVS